MLKKVREFKEALKEFRRSAGQIRRYHPGINPDKFLEGVTTRKGVERALDKLRYTAERENIEKRVAEYEARHANQYEEWEKKEDIKRQKKIHDKAWKKFKKKREGLNWSRADYDLFWDTFGSPDIIDFYGSDQIIETGQKLLEINKDNLMSPQELAEMALKVATVAKNTDEIVTVEQAVDKLYSEVTAEIERRRKQLNEEEAEVERVYGPAKRS